MKALENYKLSATCVRRRHWKTLALHTAAIGVMLGNYTQPVRP